MLPIGNEENRERARLRMLATQSNETGRRIASSLGQLSIAAEPVTARDETAKAVGIGSGRTYERQRDLVNEASSRANRSYVSGPITSAMIGANAVASGSGISRSIRGSLMLVPCPTRRVSIPIAG